MTTNIERFRVNSDDGLLVYFEENHDLTVQLLQGGQRTAHNAERGVVLVYLGVDDEHDEVQVHPLAAEPSVEQLTKAIEQLTTVRNELRRLA